MRRSARATGVGTVIVALLAPGLLLAPVARAESGYRYWSFWVGDGTDWRFATEGPATTRTENGDVFGWRFAITSATGSSDAQPRITPQEAFATACADVTAADGEHVIAIALDFGTADTAPEGEVPPSARTECVVAVDGSTAAQSLSSIATLRVEQGFVCGVDGYPAAECAPAVDLPESEPAIDSAGEDATAPDATGPDATPAATSTVAAGQGGSGPPVSLIVFAAVLLVVLIGIALAVTRKSRR